MRKVSSLKRLSFENGLFVKSMLALFAATMSGHCSDVDDDLDQPVVHENENQIGDQDQGAGGSQLDTNPLELRARRLLHGFPASQRSDVPRTGVFNALQGIVGDGNGAFGRVAPPHQRHVSTQEVTGIFERILGFFSALEQENMRLRTENANLKRELERTTGDLKTMVNTMKRSPGPQQDSLYGSE
jgi:hypothetical protein